MAGVLRGTGVREGCSRRPHRVLMVSDFFYPNFGGVENHIYQLSQCLTSMGLKVVVVTHAYGDCRGVRYLTNGLKVYYLPRLPFYQQATFPTLLGWCRLLRVICVRERITLVHGHQAFSTMALEACINARSLGLKVVFTDHSLFGFADPASIVLNKVLKAVLSDVDAVICVSHTSKENTVLRACLPPAAVSVIPNAVDASQFEPPELQPDPDPDPEPYVNTQPEARPRLHPEPGPGPDPRVAPGPDCKPRCKPGSDPGPDPRVGGGRCSDGCGSRESGGRYRPCLRRRRWPRDPHAEEVVLVVLCRLVYRKGVDLLSLVLPAVCGRHPHVRVIVGGDGPKRALLERVISDHGLEDRVVLEGAVPHERARDFMVRGHVFVNASLTEAFCMALVEAAAAGLVVVSTAVGGVPEVLPPDMIVLSEPSAEGLREAIEAALLRVPHQRPAEQHERVRKMYDWNDVARRTVHVYDQVAASTRDDSLPARLQRYSATGRWVGAFFGAVAVLSHLWMALLEWWQPRTEIDLAPDWPRGGAAEAEERTAAATATSCTATAAAAATAASGVQFAVRSSEDGLGSSRIAAAGWGMSAAAATVAKAAVGRAVGAPAAAGQMGRGQQGGHALWRGGKGRSGGVVAAAARDGTSAGGVGDGDGGAADVLADSRVYGNGGGVVDVGGGGGHHRPGRPPPPATDVERR